MFLLENKTERFFSVFLNDTFFFISRVIRCLNELDRSELLCLTRSGLFSFFFLVIYFYFENLGSGGFQVSMYFFNIFFIC